MTDSQASRWTERQRRMLAAMGLRLWEPAGAAGGPGLGAEAVAAAVAETMAEAVTPSLPLAAVSPGARSRSAQPGSDASVESGPPRRVVTPTAAPSSGLPSASALDWSSLQTAVADCTRCRLHLGRTQAVFGSGAADACWLIVGDPPSVDEDASGQPFVGDAGRLLDLMLAALQLSRSADPPEGTGRVYTTLALRCRPATGGPAGAAEWAACEGHLRQQVALLRPRLMVVLGRIAAQSLLRSEAPIGQLRGRVHAWHGVPLVVSYPPAYLLRHADLKARAWEDWCRAAALLS